MRSEPMRVLVGVGRCSRVRMACAFAIVALAAAGCGGGSGTTASSDAGLSNASTKAIPSSTPVGPSLTRSQLITRADAICKRRNTAIDAVKLAGATGADVARFASQSATLEQTAFLELGKLSPPSAMAAGWRAILAYDRTLLEAVLKLGEYGERNQTSRIAALAHSTQRVKSELLAAAARDGFRYCSRVR
jgi:hypothetical protein